MEKAALGAAATYTTPRTLLSILRLSQALAKLRFSNLVEQVRPGRVGQDGQGRVARKWRRTLADSLHTRSAQLLKGHWAPAWIALRLWLSSLIAKSRMTRSAASSPPPPHHTQSDVDEALRLMRQSKASLESSGPGVSDALPGERGGAAATEAERRSVGRAVSYVGAALSPRDWGRGGGGQPARVRWLQPTLGSGYWRVPCVTPPNIAAF